MRGDSRRTIRLLLLGEGASFLLAALVHAGVVADRWDPGAAIAETVIGGVLLAALWLAVRNPARTRALALGAQGFGLVGTMIGTYLTAVVGLGTAADVAYHLTILSVLAAGLFVAARATAAEARRGVE